MPKVLIAGCGFVGEATAGFFVDAGWEVVGMTASRESADAMAAKPFSVGVGNLGSSESVRAFVSHHGPFEVVVHCASSGRGGADVYRRVYRDGLRHLVEACEGAKLVFTGSTSVYAQADGSVVDETSVTDPDRETGRVLLEAETVALEAGGFVARLGGIYGPERSVLLRKFLEGSAVVESGGDRWINQIHRDDAARALVHVVSAGLRPGIYNVVDDVAARQRQVYEWLAEYFDRPIPPDGSIDPNRKRGVTNKRVSNEKLRATGWSPKFSSFRDALPFLGRGGNGLPG